MVLKHLEDNGRLVGYAFTQESITYGVPLWYIKELEDSDQFIVELEKVVTGTVDIRGSSDCINYKNKDILNINKDFSFLSYALFSKNNVELDGTTLIIKPRKYSVNNGRLVYSDSEFRLENVKPKLNNTINIKNASIQGSLIVIGVEEVGNNSPFEPLVEYELLVKLATKTIYVYNDFASDLNSLVTLAFTGKNIAVVNKAHRQTMHNIVSANINQCLDYIVDTVIGKIAILSSTYKNGENTVYKVECKFLAEEDADVLLLSTFFTEDKYIEFLKRVKKGYLVVENGQTIVADKIYNQREILSKMIRRG